MKALSGVVILLICAGWPLHRTAAQDIKDQETTYPTVAIASTLELIPVYRTQERVFQSFPKDTAAQARLILDSLFDPHRSVLEACFGYTGVDYVNAQRRIYVERGDEMRQAGDFFAAIRFDRMLENYRSTFPAFTGRPVGGRFYFSFFERKICNFCGCDMHTMQMDMLAEANRDSAHLAVLLPHELNHNAFETSQGATADRETVLYKAVDEGFANYVSQRMSGVEVHVAFGMSEGEYQWYLDHEAEIKARVKPLLLSENEEDWDPLGLQVADSFMVGSPGNIGYFVGYRIVEEYLKKVGSDQWRDVYALPVRELYERSGW